MEKNYYSNKIWALVPARSGSKSIKNKNLKKIGNYSLVARAVRTAKNCKYIDRVFLSTDSIKIQKEGIKYKAEVPFLRSKKNSRNSSTDYDVMKEFLSKISKIEKTIPKYILYLRPTTPIRSNKILEKAIQKMKKLNNYDSLTSVHKMSEPVHKKFFIKNRQLISIFSKMSLDKSNEPRQNFPNSYTANGYLDIIKSKNILKHKKYLYKKCFPFLIPETIDIDTKFDLALAKFLTRNKNYV